MPEPAMTAGDMLMSALNSISTVQANMIDFSWASGDSLTITILKRSFLLAPCIALIFAFWLSLPNILSLLVRSHRLDFLKAFVSCYWDLLHSIFSYMAGIIRALLNLVGYIVSLLRLCLLGLATAILDVFFAPFRAVRAVGRNVAAPGLPWIATLLTLAWCLLEAGIFTYVMSPLVIDTLSNLSGDELYESSVRIPLFLFLLTLVLGSYAVLAAWTDAIRERSVASILRISAVELVAVLLEVLFLYREFVDALVPWFAMHMEQNFEPSAAVILGIAFMIWLGVRGMTWFLFGSHGTPVILAVIRGEGLPKPEGQENSSTGERSYSSSYMESLRKDMEWLNNRSLEMLGALILPPMQLVAACVNFLLLLFSGKNPIRIPFKDLNDLAESASILHPAPRRSNLSAANSPVAESKGVLS